MFAARAFLTALCLFWALPAMAQDATQDDVPDMDDTATNIFQQETLTGHSLPYRKKMEDAGIFVGADEIFDALANPSGGVKQGAAFEGRFELFANVSLDKALGSNDPLFQGLLFHVNAYRIDGRGLSADDVGNLLTVSNIGARPTTRLFGLWLQKSLFNDTLSIRAGQIAADDEFFISQYAALFINSAFGWPSILGINLPSGGPAYPLATPGIRVREALSPALTISTAIFNGDPAPTGNGDPQARDGSGTDFRFNGGLFWISEVAYSTSLALHGDALPGTFKLGGWYHDGLFADQRFDTLGRSLADPLSNGIAAARHGDYGGYAIADQLLWRASGTGDTGLGAFLRVGGDPDGRNLIAFHADTGFSLSGVVPGRVNDSFGIGLSYDQVSNAQRDLTSDINSFDALNLPPPDFESVLEVSYQAQIAPWWIVQPDAQVIFHPGARLADLAAPSQTATPANAITLGFRTAISF